MPADDSIRKQLTESQRIALETFRFEHGKDVDSYAISLTGPYYASDAADLVQDMYLRLTRCLSEDGDFIDRRGARIARIDLYAKTLLRHLYFDYLAKRSRITSLDQDSETTDGELRPAFNILDKVARQRHFDEQNATPFAEQYGTLLQHLLARLDPNMRGMLLMRVFEERSIEEIAEAYALDLELTGYTINLARTKLRFWLKRALRPKR